MLNNGLFTSNKEDWETPILLFYEIRKEFDINVDLCSNENNFLCKEHYTKENSCFNHIKDLKNKNIYCNPPYGRQIKDFIRLCYELKDQNNVIVMLLPARTDTSWFHRYIYNKAEIRFIKGRLKFSNSKNSAPFPSMLVIYRKEIINEKK